jgi:hypothetical protein
MVLIFYFSNDKLKSGHNKNILDLLEAISINENQIEKRRNNLDRYDLLKHNIEESLITQEEISIDIS